MMQTMQAVNNPPVTFLNLDITSDREIEAATAALNEKQRQGWCFHSGAVQHVTLGDRVVTILHATFHRSHRRAGDLLVKQYAAETPGDGAVIQNAAAELCALRQQGWRVAQEWRKDIVIGKQQFPALVVVLRKAVRT